jgi:OmpA-OmpF porin, OOP family
MKKIAFYFLVALFPFIAFTQNADKNWAVGLGPGIYINLGASGKGLMPEFYLARYLSPTFDIIMKSSFGLKQSNETSSANFFNGTINLRLKLNHGKTKGKDYLLKPYLYAGPGYLKDNTGNLGSIQYNGGMNFNAGIGTKFRMGSNTSFLLEAGYIHGVNGIGVVDHIRTEVHDNFIKLTGIFEFAFGKIK